MAKDNSKRNKIFVLIVILVVLISVLICVSFCRYVKKEQIVQEQRNMINADFYPVKDVMISSGYQEDDNIFKKDISEKKL